MALAATTPVATSNVFDGREVMRYFTFKKHAQNGRGIKRPPKELRSVSVLTVARIRALCALKKHTQDGRGIKRPPEGLRSVSSLLVARIRALCALRNTRKTVAVSSGRRKSCGVFLLCWWRASAPFALRLWLRITSLLLANHRRIWPSRARSFKIKCFRSGTRRAYIAGVGEKEAVK